MTRRRPTPDELAAAAGSTVPDLIAPGLRVLFCGINPSLYSAVVGHHFARPGNRFWRALYEGGFTDRLLHPSEEHLLLEAGCGITNFAEKATASAAEVPDEALVRGMKQLRRKIERFRPRWLAILGIGAFRTVFARPRAVVGPQPERLAGTRIWVLPNPSGLNAHYTPPQLAALFADLHRAVSSEHE